MNEKMKNIIDGKVAALNDIAINLRGKGLDDQSLDIVVKVIADLMKKYAQQGVDIRILTR